MSTSQQKPRDVEELLGKLREMRRTFFSSNRKPGDVEAMLGVLAEMRNSIPGIDQVPAKRSGGDGRTSFAAEDFDTATLIEALEALAGDISAYVDRKREELYAQALHIYYTFEELARDPANADLIPQLETMRRAYEHDYGRPIPPRPTPEGDGE